MLRPHPPHCPRGAAPCTGMPARPHHQPQLLAGSVGRAQTHSWPCPRALAHGPRRLFRLSVALNLIYFCYIYTYFFPRRYQAVYAHPPPPGAASLAIIISDCKYEIFRRTFSWLVLIAQRALRNPGYALNLSQAQSENRSPPRSPLAWVKPLPSTRPHGTAPHRAQRPQHPVAPCSPCRLALPVPVQASSSLSSSKGSSPLPLSASSSGAPPGPPVVDGSKSGSALGDPGTSGTHGWGVGDDGQGVSVGAGGWVSRVGGSSLFASLEVSSSLGLGGCRGAGGCRRCSAPSSSGAVGLKGRGAPVDPSSASPVPSAGHSEPPRGVTSLDVGEGEGMSPATGVTAASSLGSAVPVPASPYPAGCSWPGSAPISGVPWGAVGLSPP